MSAPVRPGVIIRELLNKEELTIPEAAVKMGIRSAYLSYIIRGIAGDRLSEKMVTRLAGMFDETSEEYWHTLSDEYHEHRVNNERN